MIHQAWLNGHACSDLLVEDRGLMYGDGFFTTILCYQQVLTNWPAHWRRLQTSAQRLGFPELNEAELLAQLSSAVLVSPEISVIKLVITRGKGTGYAPPNALEFKDLSLIIQLSSAPQGVWAKTRSPVTQQVVQPGLQLIVCQTPVSLNAALAGIKHLNRLDNVLARAEVVKAGVDEGLMLDSDNTVICGTQSNLVLVKANKLLTPLLDQAGVSGTCLTSLPLVLSQAGLAYNWQQTRIRLEDLGDADALFMCNAVRGVQAVGRFRDKNYDLDVIQPINQAWWQYLIAKQ
ncbi:aminodeoxychorismate lyase [Thiomicrospira sp. R3]|uniref:aminodeoxychorismate lyase n=1 Tax=Thiomicrospira sp. R3 TaxID=3035472 RepID=UPI00259AF514|nr:aminodeoxychorismate lyase [Thiomicrospira sp. R3]WFE67993.1 aminodeoxychorismate lyase [Thiomicrospira sp. R3]